MRALWYIFLSLWLTTIIVDGLAYAQATTPPAGAAQMPSAQPQRETAADSDSCGGPTSLPPRGANNPAPGNPAEKVCEHGHIHVTAGSIRRFGHRIMDLVEITIFIESAPAVLFDLQSLQRGVIGFNGQEFDLADERALAPGESPVTVTLEQLDNGNKLLRIDLIVQTSVPASVTPYVVFRMDLRYSPGFILDSSGVQTTVRDWRILTTPDTAITLSATAMAGDNFIAPAGEFVPTPSPWPMWSLLVGGIFLIGLWPGLVIVRFINRIRPGRKISPKELAWRTVSRVMADGRRYGFQDTHFREIVIAIRKCFNLSSAALMEARELMQGREHAEEIIEVLEICDEVLYKKQEPSAQDIERFLSEVTEILKAGT